MAHFCAAATGPPGRLAWCIIPPPLTVSLWGRGALRRFDGREGTLSLDGEVTSVMLGADWTRDPGSKSGAGSGAGAWTAGLLMSRSEGTGSYRGEGEGEVESALTGVYPYGRYMVNRRVTLWGVAGYGVGELTLRPKPAPGSDPGDAAAIRTDMDLVMGAIGVRGVAVEAGPQGGMELTVTSDAMAVRTASEKAKGIEGATADVTRLRLGLEGTWRGLAVGEAGKCPKDTRHRQVKYLNNVVEADHGKLKLLIRPVRGFKTMKTAYATIRGFEVMRALRKGEAGMFALQGGIVGEARIVERAFGLGPCALTEAMALLQDRLASAET